MLAYRSCASLTSERLPNSASASSKNRTRSPAAAAPSSFEVLLGLADVLADDRRQVDLVQVQPQNAGHHLGGQRLSGAGRPGEQRHHSGRRHRRELPPAVHDVAAPVPGGQFAPVPHVVGRQHQVVPPSPRPDPHRHPVQVPAGQARTAGASEPSVEPDAAPTSELIAAEPVPGPAPARTPAASRPCRPRRCPPGSPPRPRRRRIQRLLQRRGTGPTAGGWSG